MVAQGGQINIEDVPGADFYYKMVAKIDNEFYSIWDSDTKYTMNEVLF